MMTPLTIGTIANVATALAVLTGVIFGLVEIRHARKEREDRAAFEVIHTIMTADWMRSIILVQGIDESLTPQALEGQPELLRAAQSVGIILEGLGYAVFKRIVPLGMVEQIVGGSVRVAWRKMRPYIELERERSGSQKSWEWFQWLAERLEQSGRPDALQHGAQELYRDWRP